jgi:sulfite reductase alpha subunit-like flavoprotein
MEVLSEFRSAKVPREYVFDLFPTLRPREFSIASSIKVYYFITGIRVAHQYDNTRNIRDESNFALRLFDTGRS